MARAQGGQIANASHKSHSANLIKVNVRSVAMSPPVEWSKQRGRVYVEFCTAVVNQLRGTSAILEAEFDAARERALLSVAD
jgi:hypothetical protein